MPVESVGTLVVGAGQAGLAASCHLSKLGLPHLVVERHRIAERWRSERWDSLVANGPAWHDRFPELTFSGVDDDGFASRDQIVRYFETFATQAAAPVRCGVDVGSVRRHASGEGFLVETSQGLIEAGNVIAATGPFQRPLVPDLVPDREGLMQIHSSAYRNPAQLPDGPVLVVGAGSSGVQIADELLGAGRQVYLAVGPHNRPPRRYRGQDFCWWLGALGKWDVKTMRPGMEHVTIAVSGAHGGRTIDFRRLAWRGMTLVGRLERFDDGVLHFAPDLNRNIAMGDADYLAVLDEADAYTRHHGLVLPEDPEARRIDPDPPCMTDPIRALNLNEAGIGAIVWATGYARDFGWLKLDAFDGCGNPTHENGVSIVPGLYFLGLPWLTNRSSSFIWGVWNDAKRLADHISARSPHSHAQRGPLPSHSAGVLPRHEVA